MVIVLNIYYRLPKSVLFIYIANHAFLYSLLAVFIYAWYIITWTNNIDALSMNSFIYHKYYSWTVSIHSFISSAHIIIYLTLHSPFAFRRRIRVVFWWMNKNWLELFVKFLSALSILFLRMYSSRDHFKNNYTIAQTDSSISAHSGSTKLL